MGGRAYRNFTGQETPAQGGKVNRLKKAEQWSKFTRDLIPKSTRQTLTDKANSYIEGAGGKVNRLKKAQQWSKFTRDLIPKSTRQALTDKANSYIEGAGMVYSNELRKAIGGCSDMSGGAKKKRAGRFVKGSPEAKAWGEKMRQARLNK